MISAIRAWWHRRSCSMCDRAHRSRVDGALVVR